MCFICSTFAATLSGNFGLYRLVYFSAFVLQVFAMENLLDLDSPYNY